MKEEKKRRKRTWLFFQNQSVLYEKSRFSFDGFGTVYVHTYERRKCCLAFQPGSYDELAYYLRTNNSAHMCSVGYNINDKSALADLDTLLSTPTGPGLSHVRMVLPRYVVSSGSPLLELGWVFVWDNGRGEFVCLTGTRGANPDRSASSRLES